MLNAFLFATAFVITVVAVVAAELENQPAPAVEPPVDDLLLN